MERVLGDAERQPGRELLHHVISIVTSGEDASRSARSRGTTVNVLAAAAVCYVRRGR